VGHTQSIVVDRGGRTVVVQLTLAGLPPMGVVFPAGDYYDLTWVLIPFALARATILQARGADVNAKTADGMTPLWAATAWGRTAVNRLSAKALFPMHARGREHVYTEFARKAASDGIRGPVHCAEFPGDHFASGGVAGGSVLGLAVHSANNTEAIDKLRDRDLQPERVMDVIGRRLCE
jgi:hypothetical protein